MGRGIVQGGLRDAAPVGLNLIETLFWPAPAGRLALHQARLARGCAAFGIGAVPDLAVVLAGAASGRARVTVDLAGRVEVAVAPFVPETGGPPTRDWRVQIVPGLDSTDPFRAHKTTARGIYDRARAALPAGVDEAVFLNERGEVAEGTITTVFVPRAGVLLTPPCASGCLPGVLRAELLAGLGAREATLFPGDLAGGFFLGNALRGLIRAALV